MTKQMMIKQLSLWRSLGRNLCKSSFGVKYCKIFALLGCLGLLGLKCEVRCLKEVSGALEMFEIKVEELD